jgi:alanine racemase
VQSLAPRAEILPMVKANAYGQGLLPVGKFFTEQCGARALGTATLGEAEEILASLPNFQRKIYVFSDTNLGFSGARYDDPRLLPVVSTMEGLTAFLRDHTSKPLVLKLNTGMNRIGIDEEDWEAAGKQIKAAGRQSIHHLMTHYALSYHELKDGDKCHRQREAFERGKKLFQAQGLSVEETSLANSGAIEQKFTTEETWVRPGLMLYGPASFKHDAEIVSDLVTRVIKVFPVKRGVPVGYGTNVTMEDGLMAVLPIGYGDGWLTQASGWRLTHAGLEAKVFGRVNMDMSFLFFPTTALGKIRVGDEVRLWDARPAVLGSLAEHMQTHTYQTLCAINGRVPRVYRLE